MSATAPMTKQKNSERLASTKVKIRDAFQNHAGDIERNTPKYYGMEIFADAKFLVTLIEKLTGGDSAKLNSLTVVDDDVPAISAAA